MYPMMSYLQIKTRAGLHKMFKEERGASGTIEAVVLLGIVIILAFLFKDAIMKLFKGLWDSLVVGAARNNGTPNQVSVDPIELPNAAGTAAGGKG